jgi:ceramide glucosyltransferase
MLLVIDLLLLTACVGSALILWGAWLIPDRPQSEAPGTPPAISILKPLHGDEPRLLENLASALDQDYPAQIEMICGVASAADPAIAVVQRLRIDRPQADLRLIVDPRRWGANRKVSNLANIAAHARHDMIVLADSDMAVPRDYLTILAAALDRPGVGAVTCLYRGRGDAGFWSRLTALGIDLHFLPATLIGRATRLGHPCMGSTIALRRTTLDEIGGFARFADTLADDHALGAAVRACGAAVTIPDMILVHGCSETSFRALLRQELRWNATIAGIDPAGYAGSVVLHPFALAAIAWVIGGGSPALAVLCLGFVARAAVAVRLGMKQAHPREIRPSIALIPLRDLLSFALFLGAFAVRSVDWRGTGIKLGSKGRVSPAKDR